MLTLFKFSQLVISQLVRTDVTVQTFQSLVKQNTLKISYVSERGFSSFKTLITWYDRQICKKYRTMQEDLPTSYLLSSPCTQHMQDTKWKRLDIRTVFWVCDLKELFFPPGHHTIVRRKNSLQGHFPWMQLIGSARIYDKCQTMNKSFYILPACKVLSQALQRQSSMDPAHHHLVYSTGIGDFFF